MTIQTNEGQHTPKACTDRKRRLQQVYRTKYKEPFYKGGTVQDRIPSFTDRILYYSLHTCEEQLIPQMDSAPLRPQTLVYPKSNSYGVVSHYLKGSDHSAIYCAFDLHSPIMVVRPPGEWNEQFVSFSYVQSKKKAPEKNIATDLVNTLSD